jgi:hypothetical protein
LLAPAQFFETDSASGNVAATIGDMVRLMMALIGASNGQPLLDSRGEPTISRAMFERITSTKAPTGEPVYTVSGTGTVEESRYAMGINVERIGDHFCVSHGGGMVGYSTFMLVDCSAGVGVTVLTNANGDTLASHLLARVALHEVTERLEGRMPKVATRWNRRTLARSPASSDDDEGVGTFTSTSSGLTRPCPSSARRRSAGEPPPTGQRTLRFRPPGIASLPPGLASQRGARGLDLR